MTTNIFPARRLATSIVLLMLTCGVPTHAWCANLWVSFYRGSGIESYTSQQLKKSGMPTSVKVTGTLANSATGLAFDKSKNLWAVIDDDKVVQFTVAQLKNLKKNPSPTPGVIITSMSFSDLIGCNFDQQGNLWLVDAGNNQLDELSKTQLAAGSADITAPAKVITSPDLDFPNFVTFDKAGNAWVDSEDNSKIAEFSASQLTSSGSKSAAVLLSTSLCDPGQIAFDKNGNLWIPGYCTGTAVEYAKGQLTSSGSPTPTVTLSSAAFDGPWGAVFDSKGDLVIVNYNSGTILKFTAKQLKASGAPVPKVSVTQPETQNYQVIFGPAS
jgi:hypothetical protein